MKMSNAPTTARFRSLVTGLVASTLLLGACARDMTAPAASKSAPSASSKALVGVIDGIYTYTVIPGVATTLPLGKSSVTLPANSICAIGTSGYGAEFWNAPCTPQTLPVVITAIVRNALTDHPSIEFQPAMRFNPQTNVTLSIFVTNAATLSNMTVMKYCSGILSSSCVNEALTDPSLATTINASLGQVFRRIKHFSGYLIAEEDCTVDCPPQ